MRRHILEAVRRVMSEQRSLMEQSLRENRNFEAKVHGVWPKDKFKLERSMPIEVKKVADEAYQSAVRREQDDPDMIGLADDAVHVSGWPGDQWIVGSNYEGPGAMPSMVYRVGEDTWYIRDVFSGLEDKLGNTRVAVDNAGYMFMA